MSADRVAGAQAIELNPEFDLIIMDDGFQNPSLAKDVSLIVVDGRRGIGNGYAHPGGPLRAQLDSQLRRSDGVLVIGDGDPGMSVLRYCSRRGMATHVGAIRPLEAPDFGGRGALAFAGIADPQKFYATLVAHGVEIAETRDFPDHHPIQQDEAEELVDRARRSDLQLVTTSKDWVRMGASHMTIGNTDFIALLRERTKVLDVELVLDGPNALEPLFGLAVERS